MKSESWGRLHWIDGFLPPAPAAGLEERMRQRVLVAFGVILFVVTTPWYGWMFLRDPAPRAPRMVALAVLTMLAANPLWLRLASTRVVAWSTVLLVHFAVLFNVTMNHGLSGPVALAITCLPVFTAVLLGIRAGWIDLGLVILVAVLLDDLAMTYGLPITAPPEIWPMVRIMTLAISLSLMLVAVSAYAEMSRHQARELLVARDSALAATRAKSRFLSTMSHELRTPMVGVLGAAELLMRSDLKPEQREMLALLQRSAAAQLDLIGNILDLSRIEADRFELEELAVQPRQILADIESFFRLACEAKGLALRIEIAPECPSWILADGLRLRQILTNLVGNALKFTERGSIEVDVRTMGDAADSSLRLDVVDTGVGFDPELRDELFEAFRQADGSTTRRFGGNGLGLSICRHLVTAMGGTITATSTPGKGSTFSFEIPVRLATAPEESPAPLVHEVDEPRQDPLKILLADDDPVNRFVLAAMLEELGHTCIQAVDGRAALEQAVAQPIDLAILDMQMPELDGPGCARALREQPEPVSSLPILGLTADAIVENHARYLASGIDKVCSKPLQLVELRSMIAHLVDRRPGSAASDGSL